MKITQTQLIQLITILKDSIQVGEMFFSMEENGRLDLLNEIIDQQSDELIDIK